MAKASFISISTGGVECVGLSLGQNGTPGGTRPNLYSSSTKTRFKKSITPDCPNQATASGIKWCQRKLQRAGGTTDEMSGATASSRLLAPTDDQSPCPPNKARLRASRAVSAARSPQSR
eukprot:m.73178 g.73178  ORF g.73178 m.73178 type:complete len:119 (-) comp10200_c0_seq1:878-1234(-)